MAGTKGTLYLIPSAIAEGRTDVIPSYLKFLLPSIHHFLVEDIRAARRYLSALKSYPSLEALQFEVLNKDTTSHALIQLMQPLHNGHNVGVVSESGCPGIADPGALAVKYAHDNGIKVVPLVGPSSIFLALMASGLNGQRFAFNGYLPIHGKEAAKAIKEFERESELKNQTQIFIETPYRNNQLVNHFLSNLKGSTLLTIAIDITGEKEWIATKTVSVWKKDKPMLAKLPTVFCLLA
ncbi:MAG: SAM-dependent methyltransferase [Flammeovirgaceae bacterium]